MKDRELDILFEVVRTVESGGNKKAFRIEPAFAERINTNDRAYKRAQHTVYAYDQSLRLYLATSVTSVQILIYNLYFYDRLYWWQKIGNKIASIPYVLSDDDEKELFVFYLLEKGINFFPFNSKSDLELFAKGYNGSVEYADKLLEVYMSYV